MLLFFKSSWTECRRDKEPEIIATAHERAEKHLKEKDRPSVTDHIPHVITWEAQEETSTMIIRGLIGKFMRRETINGENAAEDSSRVRAWMVSRRLAKISDLRNADEVWKADWEYILCMLFLVLVLCSLY